MWEEKKCGFIALTVGIFIQWRKRRKGGLSLDVKSSSPSNVGRVDIMLHYPA
jgi:hypothetical protein